MGYLMSRSQIAVLENVKQINARKKFEFVRIWAYPYVVYFRITKIVRSDSYTVARSTGSLLVHAQALAPAPANRQHNQTKRIPNENQLKVSLFRQETNVADGENEMYSCLGYSKCVWNM